MRIDLRLLQTCMVLAIASCLVGACSDTGSSPNDRESSASSNVPRIDVQADVRPWEKVSVSGETPWRERFVELIPCIGAEPVGVGSQEDFGEVQEKECDLSRTRVTQTDEDGRVDTRMTIPPVVNHGNREEWNCIEKGCHIRLVDAPETPLAAWASIDWTVDAKLPPRPEFEASWEEVNRRQAITLTSQDFAQSEQISLMQCAVRTATGVDGNTCVLPRQAVVPSVSGQVVIRILPVRVWSVAGETFRCRPGTDSCFFAVLTPDRAYHNRMTTVDIPATSHPAFAKPVA